MKITLALCQHCVLRIQGSHKNDDDDDELQSNYINIPILKPINHNLPCTSFTLNMLATQSELTVTHEV